MISCSMPMGGKPSRLLALGCVVFSVLLLAVGCKRVGGAKDGSESLVSAYIVEERGGGNEWFYVPIQTIHSAALERFVNDPVDLIETKSDGHAADGYFALVVVVKEPNPDNTAIVWEFANSGEFIMQTKVQMERSVSDTIEFRLPKEELGKVPVFVKSAKLSEVVRDISQKQPVREARPE